MKYKDNEENHCNAIYEYSCLKLYYQWYTNPTLFIEDTLNIKLKWYQKIYLKIFKSKNNLVKK